MIANDVKILQDDYLPFFEEIKVTIKFARIQAYQKVNEKKYG